MKEFFKKYFIPHEENDHKPHILRARSVLFITSVILALEVVFLLQFFVVIPRTGFFALVAPDVLVDETNVSRVDSSLPSLKVNYLLEAAAREKAGDMAKNGYFAHVNPSGTTPWFWLEKAGYKYSYAGENLAVNFSDSHDVLNAWMNSPTHKANILNPGFTEIGIAAAEGEYKGHKATFVVQFFGQPYSSQVAGGPVVSGGGVTPGEKSTVAGTSTAASSDGLSENTSGSAVAAGTDSGAGNTAAGATIPEDTGVPQSGILENVLGSPKTSFNYVLFILGLFVTLALALKIFVKIRIQHPGLILGGMLLIAAVSALIIFNDAVSVISAAII